ncbi:MAG: hemerythrin domain-containing protein [Myxococcales bacterium]|nr:hemerythrin domain-containing protein [Myxococcales bacterium]
MRSQLTEVESRLPRRVDGVHAELKVLGGIFDTLVKEHRATLKLLRRLALTDDADLREELFPRVRQQLVVHEQAENAVLYPLLRSHAATHELAKKNDGAARRIEVILGCLSGYSFDNPEWRSTAQTLLEIVEQHIDDEETGYFPKAQRALGAQITQELNERYQEYREQLNQGEQGEREVEPQPAPPSERP